MSGAGDQQLPARNTSFQTPDGLIAPVWWNYMFRQWRKLGGGTFSGTLNDFVKKAGDTMSGFLFLSADPTQNLHATTKQYVDNQTSTPSPTLPKPVGTAATGAELRFSRGDHIHGTVGQAGYISRIWEAGAIIANGTYSGGPGALLPFKINSMDAVSDTGTFTLAIQINGVNVTGLGAVAVTAAQTNTTATAANTVSVADLVKFIVTASVANPTGIRLTLNTTRT